MRAAPTVAVALLLVVPGCPRKAPTKMRLMTPSSFAVPIIAGDEKREGTADEGMIESVTSAITQVLHWMPPGNPLADRARHEQDLIRRARGDLPGHVDDKTSSRRVDGAPALHWSARVEGTHFRASVVDCPGRQILLTSMGHDRVRIRTHHDQSLAGLRCQAPRTK